MKLYSYDHCPYCVKARMIFGLKSIPFELINLLNDDEETPVSLVGKKMVPILEKAPGSFMGESLDIVVYCDGLEEFGPKKVSPSKNDSSLENWLKESRRYNYALAMPRWVKMGLPEFATESAVQYFTEKKFSSIGPFESNLEISKSLIAMAETHLQKLEEQIVGTPYFWGEELSEDDFHVYASLRVLSCVKGLSFPKKLEAYSQFLSQESQVPLHWEQALGEEL